jgi:thiol-disulfide isomerase/thioredoxin
MFAKMQIFCNPRHHFRNKFSTPTFNIYRLHMQTIHSSYFFLAMLRFMNFPKSALKAAFILACLVLFTVSALAAPPVYLAGKVTKAASANAMAEFTWVDGKKTVSITDIAKGKPVFINFWATWCGPCRTELPDIVQLSQELKGKVVFVGIALDQERTDEKTIKLVGGMMEKMKMEYPNVISTSSNDLSKAFGNITSIPTTFIVDKNGKIVETLVGMRSKTDFVEALKKVM